MLWILGLKVVDLSGLERARLLTRHLREKRGEYLRVARIVREYLHGVDLLSHLSARPLQRLPDHYRHRSYLTVVQHWYLRLVGQEGHVPLTPYQDSVRGRYLSGLRGDHLCGGLVFQGEGQDLSDGDRFFSCAFQAQHYHRSVWSDGQYTRRHQIQVCFQCFRYPFNKILPISCCCSDTRLSYHHWCRLHRSCLS